MTTCGVCYNDTLETDLAILHDRNGHTWYLCSECVKALWAERRPPVTPEPVAVITVSALPELVGTVSALTDHLEHGGDKTYIIARLNEACAEARKVYQS